MKDHLEYVYGTMHIFKGKGKQWQQNIQHLPPTLLFQIYPSHENISRILAIVSNQYFAKLKTLHIFKLKSVLFPV